MGIFDKSLGKPLYDISQMSIMGLIDAIKKIRWFFKLADELIDLAKDVDKILLMDSSGFNLPLAKKLKLAYPKKEIIYYILPQVWASRPKRVKKLIKYCDRLLGILPFEIDMYPSKAEYVGHPLLDEIQNKNIIKKKKYIAFMPGSRKSEISKLMPIFVVLVIPASFSDEKISSWYEGKELFLS